MALAKGNVTNNTGSGTSISFSHTQNSGSDRLLFAAIYYYNAETLSNVQYNGVSMTLIATYQYAADSCKVGLYKLSSPAVGSNTFSASLSIGQSWVATVFSLTGCSGVGNFASNNLANTPHSQTLSVSANSFIYCGGTSRYTFDSSAAITIDGNATGAASCDAKGQSYLSLVRGELQATALGAGSITCIVDTIANSFVASNHRVEFLEAGGGPVTRRRIIIV